MRAARIELIADGGPLRIDGRLDASGERGGLINLVSATHITVGDDGTLLARSSGGYLSDPAKPGRYEDGYRGGQVELAAPRGRVSLNEGLVDVGGTRLENGKLVSDASGVVRITAARIADSARTRCRRHPDPRRQGRAGSGPSRL